MGAALDRRWTVDSNKAQVFQESVRAQAKRSRGLKEVTRDVTGGKGMKTSFSKRVVRFVRHWGVWLAPVATAAVVFRAGVETLHWYEFAALAAALYLEILGISTAELAADMYGYNREVADNKAPTWLAVLMTFFYLVTTVSIVAVVEIYTGLTAWMAAILPAAGLVGYYTRALGDEHDKRTAALAEVVEHKTDVERQREAMALAAEQERQRIALDMERAAQEQALEQKRLNAEARRQEKLLLASQGVQGKAQAMALSLQGKGQASGKAMRAMSESRRQVLEAIRQDPEASQRAIGNKLGITRQAVGQHMFGLEKAGYLHRNGDGYKLGEDMEVGNGEE
jgi:biotin operon repressor